MSRDFRIPYTEAELDDLRHIFRGMTTYNAETGCVKAEQIPDLADAMGYPRTDEQKAAYVAFWKQNYGDFVTMEGYIDQARALHSTAKFSYENAVRVDKNKDGLISAEEFMELLKMLSAHDPTLAGKTYEDFLKEADTDLDGKVTIDECTDWIRRHCDTRSATPTPL